MSISCRNIPILLLVIGIVVTIASTLAAAERLEVFAGQDKTNARVNVPVTFNDAELVSPDPPDPMRSYTFAWDFDTTKDLNLDGIYDNDNESATLLTEHTYWSPSVLTI